MPDQLSPYIDPRLDEALEEHNLLEVPFSHLFTIKDGYLLHTAQRPRVRPRKHH